MGILDKPSIEGDSVKAGGYNAVTAGFVRPYATRLIRSQEQPSARAEV